MQTDGGTGIVSTPGRAPLPLLLALLLAGAALLAGCGGSDRPVLPPPSQGQVRYALADHPSLANEGAVAAVENLTLLRPILLVRDQAGRLRAFDSWCPHTGCSVDPAGSRLFCSCHGSTYSLEGDVLRGPSRLPLIEYAARQEGDSLVVELGERTNEAQIRAALDSLGVQPRILRRPGGAPAEAP
jgi:nitrite reductase/ring-hydroxylating ferredoxin subunit